MRRLATGMRSSSRPWGDMKRPSRRGKRAQELEPLSLVPNTVLGMTLYFARRYKEAIEQLRKTVEMEPNLSWTRCLLGDAYQGQGMYEEARMEFIAAVNAAGSRTLSLATLGHGYATSGNRSDALKVLAELAELQEREYVAPFFMALIYTGLGEKEQAFAWLDKACEDRSWGLLWLKVDPRLDDLRSDARFSTLMERVGLSPGTGSS